MPLAELEQNVQMEIDDNPALETTPPEDDSFSTNEESTDSSESYEESLEREERADALDDALQNMGSDDEMPEPSYKAFASGGAEYEEITYGDQRSFYDQLKEQMRELELSPEQQDVMEYLIGSLDNDGLLRKPLPSTSLRNRSRRCCTCCKASILQASEPARYKNVCCCRLNAASHHPSDS